ncbi:MAG TPA: hypothetical protein VMF13_06655 [Luteitalea sp.]|nr:hypothetical protein [Luteitalea sp.]
MQLSAPLDVVACALASHVVVVQQIDDDVVDGEPMQSRLDGDALRAIALAQLQEPLRVLLLLAAGRLLERPAVAVVANPPDLAALSTLPICTVRRKLGVAVNVDKLDERFRRVSLLEGDPRQHQRESAGGVVATVAAAPLRAVSKGSECLTGQDVSSSSESAAKHHVVGGASRR